MKIIRLKKIAVSEEEIEKVPGIYNKLNDPSLLPFDNIFGSKYRIIIPLENPELKKIKEKLKDKLIFDEDLKYVQKINPDKTVNERKQKSGKAIRKELINKFTEEYEKIDPENAKQIAIEETNRWMDEWSKQTNEGDDKVIVLSRHPIDILKMSDYQELSSCHSPPSSDLYEYESFFHCAIEEARNGGAVAFLIDKKDVEEVLEGNEEIFDDYTRDIKGIIPTSRIRVTRYHNNKNDFDLAVPVKRTYGQKTPGFQESLNSFLLKNQNNLINKYYPDEIDLEDFEKYGGSYRDATDSDNFKVLFGDEKVDGYGNVNTITEEIDDNSENNEEIDMIAQWNNEVQNTVTSFNYFTIKNVYMTAEVEDHYNQPYISHEIYVDFYIEDNIKYDEKSIENHQGVYTSLYTQTEAEIEYRLKVFSILEDGGKQEINYCDIDIDKRKVTIAVNFENITNPDELMQAAEEFIYKKEDYENDYKDIIIAMSENNLIKNKPIKYSKEIVEKIESYGFLVKNDEDDYDDVEDHVKEMWEINARINVKSPDSYLYDYRRTIYKEEEKLNVVKLKETIKNYMNVSNNVESRIKFDIYESKNENSITIYLLINTFNISENEKNELLNLIKNLNDNLENIINSFFEKYYNSIVEDLSKDNQSLDVEKRIVIYLLNNPKAYPQLDQHLNKEDKMKLYNYYEKRFVRDSNLRLLAEKQEDEIIKIIAINPIFREALIEHAKMIYEKYEVIGKGMWEILIYLGIATEEDKIKYEKNVMNNFSNTNWYKILKFS